MSNIPSFNLKSRPAMSESEVDASRSDGSKFLNDPGTYDAVVKKVTFKKASEKDSAWLTVELELEIEGKSIRLYQMIPTECRNSFLFGDKKQTFAIDKLRAFFRGLGLVFDFENGMEQVAALFGSPDKLIGKTLKVRLGYEGAHAKYLAKDEYVYVDKDHTTALLDGVFANKAAIEAACREAGLRRDSNHDFIKVVEIFAAKEAVVDLSAGQAEADVLPF